MTLPVLLLIFNRPDKTARILDAIRQAQPPRLYVAADGPRPKRQGETETCAQTRAVIDGVDWDCTVHRLFRDRNLGCRKAVSEGITWFFEQEAEGIVLEDDILPDPSFFSFAAAMLARYRDDPRVMSITACNPRAQALPDQASYSFSAYNHVWGWASWARAWACYDHVLDDLDTPGFDATIDAMCPVPGARTFWKRHLLEVRDGRLDTWDYSWLYSQWKARGLTVKPRVNMMQNIGFDGSGTHTNNANMHEATLRPHPLTGPYIHPAKVTQDIERDAQIAKQVFGIRPYGLLRRLNLWRKGDRQAWV